MHYLATDALLPQDPTPPRILKNYSPSPINTPQTHKKTQFMHATNWWDKSLLKKASYSSNLEQSVGRPCQWHTKDLPGDSTDNHEWQLYVLSYVADPPSVTVKALSIILSFSHVMLASVIPWRASQNTWSLTSMWVSDLPHKTSRTGLQCVINFLFTCFNLCVQQKDMT